MVRKSAATSRPRVSDTRVGGKCDDFDFYSARSQRAVRLRHRKEQLLVACAHRGWRRSCDAGRSRPSGTRIYCFLTIVGCLVVNQVAYVLAIRLNDDQSGGAAEDLPEQRAHGVPRDDRNDDVRHKEKKGQSLKFDLARLADY